MSVLWRLRVSVALVLMALAVTSRAQAGLLRDTWFVTTIDGKRVGYLHELQETDVQGGQKIIRTRMETRFTFRRMGTEIAVQSEATFIETTDGKALRFVSTNKLANADYEITAEQRGDHFLVRQTSMGKTTETEVPYSEDILFPHAIDQEIRSRALKPGARIELRTFSPDLARPTKLTIVCTGREPIEIDGERLDLLRLESSQDVLPGVALIEYRDDQARVRRSELPILGTTIVSVETTRELATMDPESVEFLVSTLIDPGEVIAHPRRVERLVLELTGAADTSLDLPEDDRQRVIASDGPVRVLEIRRETWKPLPPSPAPNPEYRLASSVLQSDDPRIKALAKSADLTGSPGKIARRISRWVFTTIEKKSLGVGFATAAEVARDLTGDCTEHAVLAAALARTSGLPSRVAVGLVYVNGAFGYHMWTEIYDDGWRAIDPALGQEAIDATHIKLGTSSLANGFMDDGIIGLVPLITNLGIKVREYTLDGKTYPAGAALAAGRLSGDGYVNPIYRVRFAPVPGWKLVARDPAAGPSTLVRLTGPEGAHGELSVTTVGYDFRIINWLKAHLPGRTVRSEFPVAVADIPGRAFLVEGSDGAEGLLAVLDRENLFTLHLGGTVGVEAALRTMAEQIVISQ